MDARQGKVIRPFLGEPHFRAFKDKQVGELRWTFQSEVAASCAKAEERHGFLGRGSGTNAASSLACSNIFAFPLSCSECCPRTM